MEDDKMKSTVISNAVGEETGPGTLTLHEAKNLAGAADLSIQKSK
jgi:hypothetical protein